MLKKAEKHGLPIGDRSILSFCVLRSYWYLLEGSQDDVHYMGGSCLSCLS